MEVNRPKEKNLIVGVIYRPPKQSLQEFINDLDLLIIRISKENKKCYIMADWNIDLMKDKTGEFLDIMFSRSFYPLISRPTRITSNTATVIDNIFTNDPNNCSASGLLFTDISDHLPIFTILSDHCKNTSKNIYVTFHDKNANNMAAFKAELQTVNWDDVTGHNDPNSAYETFLSKYVASYNKSFPLKKVKARNGHLNKTWLSKGLLKSIKRKNILYKRYLCNPSSDRENQYKKYRNKLISCLRAAKRIYYAKKLEECKSNMKSTWTILNEVINNKKSKSNLPTTFNVDDKEISYPTQIADHFCAYFTNIGPNLANSIPPCLTSHRSFLSGAFMNSLYLQPTTEQKIIEICASFLAGTTAGYDQITMNVIKEIIDLIVQPLMYITNLSLSSGTVPDQMKIARVVPLFKTGDLSLLPIIDQFLFCRLFLRS